MSDDKADGILDHLEEHREAAIDAMDRANPSTDIETAADLYEEVSPLDENNTYTFEITLEEYELVKLVSQQMETLSQPSTADEVVVATSVLMQLVEGAPEHVERMSALGEVGTDNVEPRGFH